MKSISLNFKHRFLIGSFSIPIVGIFIYFSLSYFDAFTLFCAGLGALALSEYYNLAERKGLSSFKQWCIASSILYFMALAFDLQFSSILSLWILLTSSIAIFATSFFYPSSALINLAIAFFGIGYLTLPLSCILRIDTFFLPQGTEDGRLWLFYVILISKITDVGAYICGKMWGKRKLAPSISPKKTFMGAVGGLLVAVVASFLFAQMIPEYGAFYMTPYESVILGVVLSILAQFGDLAESQLKRDVGTKDSSDIPGFGGVLDTLDSLVFTLPFVYFWLLTTK